MIIVSTRGGLYAPGMPSEANHFQKTYMRAVFAFIGIAELEIARAENLALGSAQREAAMRAASAAVPAAVTGLAA